MGAKPLFYLPISRRSAGTLFLAGTFAAAFAFTSCISDGPNKTGGDYLAKNGILLQDPLYHVTLRGIQVDSFWTTDAEPNHLGDSILLAGHSGDFTAEAGFAFLVDTTFLDSLTGEDSTSLKLSLGFPPSAFATEELKATVEDSTSPDSLRFRVAAWDTTDEDLTGSQWSQLVNEWNRRYLQRQDTLSALPQPSATDTITLAVKDAYARISQSRPLPRLRQRLLEVMGRRHVVQLRLIPILESAADSGAAMLRLGGQLGDGNGLAYGPLLLFGKYDSSRTTPAANRIQALFTGGLRGVNYSLRYSGPPENILPAKLRGLHVILNRGTLLDSINADLRRQNLPIQDPPAGEFDLTYFVPFAKMTLPLAGSRLEGDFPLQINLISSVDTLLGDEENGTFAVDQIGLDQDQALWQTFEQGSPGKVRNDVNVAYRSTDQALLRRVELTFSKDSSGNDTLFLAVGGTKQMRFALPEPGSSRVVTLKLEAGEDALTVRSYVSTHPVTEPNEFRDPATGELIEDMERRITRFLHPDSAKLTLRATTGIQRLLNRAQSGTKIEQDFQFQPAVRAAIDSTVDLGSGNVPRAVPYPVLSVVTPQLDGGTLKVDVELYLFPLKAR